MDTQKIRKLLIGDFTITRLIRSVVFIYVCILIFAYFVSDRIIFVPQPSSYKDNTEIVKIEVEDQTFISALYLPNSDAKFTVFYSHGNAEDIGNLRPLLTEFVDRGFSVFAYDYQGYGTSDGRPSAKGTYRDVEAAFRYLAEQLKVPADRIIVLGRSVGGGLAMHIASTEEIAGLILESSFITAFRVTTHIPILPFDKFRNIAKIKKVRCPVLIIHGKDDRIVPIWHGKKLFEKANEAKLHMWVNGAGHNDLFWVAGNDYWEVMERFTALIEREDTAQVR